MAHTLKALLALIIVLPILYFTVVTPMGAYAQLVFSCCMMGGCYVISSLSRKHSVSAILILVSVHQIYVFSCDPDLGIRLTA